MTYRRSLWLLLAPFAVGSVVLVLGPALVSGYFALVEYDSLSPPTYRGLSVIRDLLTYPEFRDAVKATLLIAGLAIPLRLLAALALSLFLHRRGPLAGGARTAVFVPVLVPDAAIAAVWLWLLNPVYGPLGAAARGLGWGDPLLLDPWGARLAIVAISTMALGEGFLVLLAARRELPAVVFDAARVEGAGPWATFRRVTLPLLTPVLAFLLARDLVAALAVTVVPTLLLTAGGPLRSTLTLPVLVYERGFFELRFGDAAAAAVLLFLGSLVVVAIEVVVLRRWLRRLA